MSIDFLVAWIRISKRCAWCALCSLLFGLSGCDREPSRTFQSEGEEKLTGPPGVTDARNERAGTADQTSDKFPPAEQMTDESKAGRSVGNGLVERQAGLETQFESWSKPDVVLFVTGRQDGYLEPCGCTGLDNAKGGLSRRDTLLSRIRDKSWPVVAIDTGNQTRRFGRQAEIKFQRSMEMLGVMDYQSLTLGPKDLRLSIDDVISVVASAEDENSPFVSANTNLLGIMPKYRVYTVGERKVGLTSVLTDSSLALIENVDEIEHLEPVKAIAEAVSLLEGESCDHFILVSHGTVDEARALAQQFPQFRLVITPGSTDEPPLEPERVSKGGNWLIQTSGKGMYVAVIGLFDGESQSVRYEQVALDHRFSDSERILAVFRDYQKQLEELGWDGLEIRPMVHPSGNHFVGSAACRDCHESAYDVFVDSEHFRATIDIKEPTERSTIPRNFDPECVSCHVTGWDPQNHVPFESGYIDFEESASLHAVGCENCHGPGSAHVSAENGDESVSESERESRQLAMRISRQTAEKSACQSCHDLDNSPDFDFESYWEEVNHNE